ncbi:MAG: hypothetical protein ISS70_15890 [Phycisphaerae bacterium]|nr:hypothetical protein [Phycisphaerae bacterium]
MQNITKIALSWGGFVMVAGIVGTLQKTSSNNGALAIAGAVVIAGAMISGAIADHKSK